MGAQSKGKKGVRVHYGGPHLTVGSTIFEMWMGL